MNTNDDLTCGGNPSEAVCRALACVRRNTPLIHHITNYVTVNDCANAVIALGGSPVMADDAGEVEEMVSMASALVLNIGTLNARTVQSMMLAGKKANGLGIPIVLDPVGAGATSLRTRTAHQLIEALHPVVVRGNMSEIKSLAGLNVRTRGVDSTAGMEGAEAVAQNLSEKLDCVVAITGRMDFVAFNKQLCVIRNGHEMLSRITGAGCMTTSLVGTCLGAVDDPWIAASAGIACMGVAGELAHEQLQSLEGPGTFKARLLDCIFRISPETLKESARIEFNGDLLGV